MTTLIIAPTFVILLCQLSKTYSQSNFFFNKQLTVLSNDCYTRTAIGSRISEVNSTGTIQVENVSDCEDECTKRKNMCKVFSFGINIRGNATCILANRVPQSKAELVKDVDFDVFVRTPNSLDCYPTKSRISGRHIKPHVFEKPTTSLWYANPNFMEHDHIPEDYYFPKPEVENFFSNFEHIHHNQQKHPSNSENAYELSSVRKNYNIDYTKPDKQYVKNIPSNEREFLRSDYLRPPKTKSFYNQLAPNNSKFGKTKSESDCIFCDAIIFPSR